MTLEEMTAQRDALLLVRFSLLCAFTELSSRQSLILRNSGFGV